MTDRMRIVRVMANVKIGTWPSQHLLFTGTFKKQKSLRGSPAI